MITALIEPPDLAILGLSLGMGLDSGLRLRVLGFGCLGLRALGVKV